MNENKKLTNKVAFITGGGSWIGKAIAKCFVDEGAKVFLIGRDAAKLVETVAEIESLGGKAAYARADVSQEVQVQDALQQALECYGKIDILVQSAAIYPNTPIDKLSLQEWTEVIQVNLTGAFIVLKHATAIMKKEPQGRVIFISSVAGEKVGIPGFAHYGASKAGMNGLMRAAAMELAPYKITVNSINPGNILNQARFNVSESQINSMQSAIPLQRLGKPTDIANLALFLASDDSDFITGQGFVVDGGETIAVQKK